MSRRRYLSTDISTDARVNRLAHEHGDFAVVLYTWMIPHAADDATLPGDPEELLMLVIPGRRDKSAADLEGAVEAMIALGLLERVDGQRLRFPPDAFYRYQSYVTEGRRMPVRSAPPSIEIAHISAHQRGSAQNRALDSSSFSFSSSFPVSSPVSEGACAPPHPPAGESPPKKSGHGAAGNGAAAGAKGAPPTHKELTPEEIERLTSEFAPQLEGPTEVLTRIEAALNHKAVDKRKSAYLYVRNWLRNDVKYEREHANGTHRNGTGGQSAQSLRGPSGQARAGRQAESFERPADAALDERLRNAGKHPKPASGAGATDDVRTQPDAGATDDRIPAGRT